MTQRGHCDATHLHIIRTYVLHKQNPMGMSWDKRFLLLHSFIHSYKTHLTPAAHVDKNNIVHLTLKECEPVETRVSNTS
jgi:hypothetical protein